METKFIADVHLGKLARLLRMLGFDTVYQNNFCLNELLKISYEEERVLLSRNGSLLNMRPYKFFVVSSENPFNQLKQVIQHFSLKDWFQPFSRCMACNGTLKSVPKQSIAHLLQKNTESYFSEFWQCTHCKRIYWKGSHHERMLKTIENILG